jgi:hypothetical protein
MFLLVSRGHLLAQSGEGVTLDYALAQDNQSDATGGIFTLHPWRLALSGCEPGVFRMESVMVVVASGGFWYKAALFSRGPLPSS